MTRLICASRALGVDGTRLYEVNLGSTRVVRLWRHHGARKPYLRWRFGCWLFGCAWLSGMILRRESATPESDSPAANSR